MRGMQCNVELGTNSAFALRTEENLDRVARLNNI
jgi:hypothetical protein